MSLFGHPVTLAFILAIRFLLESAALFGLLLGMIRVQKLHCEWLPLAGVAVLGAAVDTVPIVGQFIVVPLLYLLIWKITHSSYTDAVFTVGLSYAFLRCAGWILVASIPFTYHPKLPQYTFNFNDETKHHAAAGIHTKKAPAAAVHPTPKPIAKSKFVPNVSILGFSGYAANTIVTFRCGSSDYTIGLGEETTVATKKGFVVVDFLKAVKNEVTLSVNGQKVQYAMQ